VVLLMSWKRGIGGEMLGLAFLSRSGTMHRLDDRLTGGPDRGWGGCHALTLS